MEDVLQCQEGRSEKQPRGMWESSSGDPKGLDSRDSQAKVPSWAGRRKNTNAGHQLQLELQFLGADFLPL